MQLSQKDCYKCFYIACTYKYVIRMYIECRFADLQMQHSLHTSQVNLLQASSMIVGNFYKMLTWLKCLSEPQNWINSRFNCSLIKDLLTSLT